MPHEFTPIIAVPARNEEARLPGLLEALAQQHPWSPSAKPLQIVIVLNNTSDRSAEILQIAAAKYATLEIVPIEVHFPPPIAHVGSARRLAMETAAALLDPIGHGVILTTDADAVPAHDWVANTIAAIAAGADLVGGKIIGNPIEEAKLGPGFLHRAYMHSTYSALCDELASEIDPLDFDPWPRHQDHTGGSLAVTLSAYRAVNGMPPLRFREDLAFVSNIVRAGYRLVHPQNVSVTVSARTEGRAPGGMADCLKSWIALEQSGAPILVENPQTVEARLHRRQLIRSLLGKSPTDARRTLEAIGINPGNAPLDTTLIGICALLETHAGANPDAVSDIPADDAIRYIEARLRALRNLTDAA